MRFVWDGAKAAANARKHRVSFEEASTVFADELAATAADPIIPSARSGGSPSGRPHAAGYLPCPIPTRKAISFA